MARPDVTQSQNARAGAELRRWRQAGKLSLVDLGAKLATVLDGRTPDGSLIAKWERGASAPGDAYFTALAQLGAPVDGWRTAGRGGPPLPVATETSAPAVLATARIPAAKLEELCGLLARLPADQQEQVLASLPLVGQRDALLVRSLAPHPDAARAVADALRAA